ncbi:Phosphatidylinositol transfer protein alpha isoform [Eumeta japonica]|uniref:Phosphatidylinositol transfer protein alpha isoform n=1 Tax=Eumeta variegata TaxID=151549 RepID=A0A4C1SW00_EUMVA|nr:Phosphatidylinositol transfer protein alpha isoform [Eumeta japonica]
MKELLAEASKNETGGGEGIEVLKNEPFSNHPLLGGKYSSGQYTYKIYHLASKVPSFIRLLAPKNSLESHEEAWNAYPYCKTVIMNPKYMKENFRVIIDSLHLQDAGNSENVSQILEPKFNQCQVFCWMDRWHGLTMEDIRAIEDKVKEELDKQRQEGEVRGTRADSD